MADIRANSKDYKRLLKERKKAFKKPELSIFMKENVTINIDESLSQPVVMVSFDNGELKEWFRGMDDTIQFIHSGYHRIIRFCPLLKKTCMGEKCQFFLYNNESGTGDCSIRFNAIIALDALKETRIKNN